MSDAIVKAAKGEVVPFAASGLRPIPQLPGVYTSLNVDDPAHLHLITKAMQVSDYDSTEILNADFQLCHVLIRRQQFADEKTGEVQDGVVCNLIGPSSEIAAVYSSWVANSIELIARLFGRPPYDPPLTVRLCETETRKGRKMYYLDVVRKDLMPVEATNPERVPTKPGQ